MQGSDRHPKDAWSDEEFVLAYGEEARRTERPVFLGRLLRKGWTDRIPTYLVWCASCQRHSADGGFTVAHEAGYGRRIECSMCGARFDQLLPKRRMREALLNPHRSPRLLAFLFLLILVAVLASR